MSRIDGRGAPVASAEDLSEISDGDGYLYPAEDEAYKIDITRLRLASCKMKCVKELCNQTDKVTISISVIRDTV